MTLVINQLLLAIEADSYPRLWRQFDEMTVEEMVWAGTTLGPDRLRTLLYTFVGRSMMAPIAQTSLFSPFFPSSMVSRAPAKDAPADVIPHILALAFKDRSFVQTKPSKVLSPLEIQVRNTLATLFAKRQAAQQINIYRDVTKTLPQQMRCPAPLSETDFELAAIRHGVSVAAIKAVAKVESGGRSGFDDEYRPKILFEAHYFGRLTKHLYDKTHPHLSTRNSKQSKPFYKWNQYTRLYEAMILDPLAACSSASWGKFQVMGENHNGWPDAISFARAMFVSEANHLLSFEDYCVTRNVMRHLKTENWAGFALGYNGKSYADFAYDVKMKKAFDMYNAARPAAHASTPNSRH